MMTHIEGPIVNSFYDMALLSWHNAMHPPLPLLAHPPPAQTNFDFGDSHANIVVKDIDGAKERSRALLKEHHEYAAGDVPQGEPMFFFGNLDPDRAEWHSCTAEHDQSSAAGPASRTYDLDNGAEATRVKSQLQTEGDVTDHLSKLDILQDRTFL